MGSTGFPRPPKSSKRSNITAELSFAPGLRRRASSSISLVPGSTPGCLEESRPKSLGDGIKQLSAERPEKSRASDEKAQASMLKPEASRG